jgi:hypothetical protein
MAPASESVDGMQMGGRGSYVIIFFAVVAIILGIWAATSGGDNNDQPTSP